MSQFFFNQRASLVNDVIEGTMLWSSFFGHADQMVGLC
ncbi:hypothetical protein ACH7BC_11950, partial [Klebsiella pneumoniae]